MPQAVQSYVGRVIASLCFFMASSTSAEIDLRGQAGVESRVFVGYEEYQHSLYINPELHWGKSGTASSFSFSPYIRLDNLDSERSRGDIRELNWSYQASSWRVSLGIDEIFWGATESKHLVDVINQVDAAGSFRNDEKLGQPMAQLGLTKDWGVIEFYLLPLFRERQFPAQGAPFSFPIPVDFEDPLYQSKHERRHVDTAVRASTVIANADIGVSLFKGTNRKPKFIFGGLPDETPKLRPYYDQIQQIGIDAQIDISGWLLKLEAIERKDSLGTSSAVALGFEYVLSTIADLPADLGIMFELAHDSQPAIIPPESASEAFLGLRLSLNNAASTEYFIGLNQDLDYSGSKAGTFVASRRIGDRYRIEGKAWYFSGDDLLEPGFFFREDDFVQIAVKRYF